MASAHHKPTLARLGAYEVLRPLARGGMAEIFLARTVGLEGFEKVLVLKRILPHYAQDARFVRSFLDEAKLVATFDHPNIAHVHDMGVDGTNYFFTMEYVHGVDVRSILKRCHRDGVLLPIEQCVLIARNIASALHYAHERRGPDGSPLGLVHRDVSPSNIIVSYDGVPKLIDFGIAKAASSTIKTQTGALKGKVSYMSPEQARGAPLDRRTDVFALGIVLWEMLACRRLYKAENDLATIQQIINEKPPSIRVTRPECPEALDQLVQRALARDPAARFQTARDLEVELEELALEHRLRLSAIDLSAWLRRVFADELAQWSDPQAQALTKTDAVAAPADDVTESDSLVPPPIPEDPSSDNDDDMAVAPWSHAPASASLAPVVADDVGVVPRRRTGLWLGAAFAVCAVIGVVIVASSGDEPRASDKQVLTPSRAEPDASPVTIEPPPTTTPPTADVASPATAPTTTVKDVAVAKPAKKPIPAKKDRPKPVTKPAKPDPKKFDPNAVFPPS